MSHSSKAHIDQMNKEDGIKMMSRSGRPAMVKVSVDTVLWHRILVIARECAPYEVQLLGELEELRSEKADILALRLVNVHIIKQKVTQASADFNMDALAMFVGDHERPESLWCWIHSHVQMGTFWSSTDDNTIARLSEGSGKLLSIVMCTDGRALGRLDLDYKALLGGLTLPFADFLPAHVRTDAVEVVLEAPFGEEVVELIRAEIREKVDLQKASLPSAAISPTPLSIRIGVPERARNAPVDPAQRMLPLSMLPGDRQKCSGCGRTYGRWSGNVLKLICEREFKEVVAECPACERWIPRTADFKVKEEAEPPFAPVGEEGLVPRCGECEAFLLNKAEDGFGVDIREGFCGETGKRKNADDSCDWEGPQP